MKDSEQHTDVWWCIYCTATVGAGGEKPDEDCPTCGNSDGWEHLATRSEGQ